MRLDGNDLAVANGAVEYAVRWLEAGQRATWAVHVASDSRGDSLVLRTAFFGVSASASIAAAAGAADADVAHGPAASTHADEAAAASDGNGQASDARRGGGGGAGGTQVTARTIEGKHAGSFEATEAGALVLCLDNHDAWWNAVRVSVELNVECT